MRVGFIGLGKMGKPMAANLMKAGFDVVVHNRSRAVVEELATAGAESATSPAEVVTRSEVVLTCLPTVDSVEQVYLGAQGLVPRARSGQVLVDHSTIGVGDAKRIAAEAAKKGVSFIDAPISGGVAGALAGSLTIMAGGDQAAFDKVLPVFQAEGQNIKRVGDVGAGTVVKLVNQLMLLVNMAGVVEGMVLGVKAGVDPQVMYDVLSTGFARSGMLDRNTPLFLQRKFDSGTNISLYVKDTALYQQLAQELGVRILGGDLAVDRIQEAVAEGLLDMDLASLVLPLERLAGVEVVRPS